MLGGLTVIVKRIVKKRTLNDLIRRGMTVGKPFSMGEDCFIDAYCWLISIGNHVALASKVQIITHDASTKLFLDHDRIGKVVIGDDVFVGQGCIICQM